jgi:hypothetical protein
LFLLVFIPFFFVYINRRTVWEGYAVGSIEVFKADLMDADTQRLRHNGPQQFAMLARIERWQRQFVQTSLAALVAHLPDKVIGSLTSEPRTQHIPDTEALVLPSEELSCALQLSPELHKTRFGILYVHHQNRK